MVNVKPIRKLLIANRGEIAIAIARTCAEMGIQTVAVFSNVDRGAPHARTADEAVRIGPAAARESYLRIDKILEAAQRTGCDAIHPGYGFLSENPEFAEACAAAEITFVGPSPEAMRAVASKTAAREIAKAVGVPIVPGAEDGYPVIVKAAAGGGGKGMRRVDRAEDLDEAMQAAAREAKAAFGDESLFVEKYIDRARHIEVQILGDHYGNVQHLYERECSIQRRHQKLIEETPAPRLSRETRDAMIDAALKIARAIFYRNAGTVEFLLAPDGRFFFIEVNARIQVEYAVTEQRTFRNLLRLQIEVAEGRPLPAELPEYGNLHAIEARLCAESASNNFLPSSGTILNWRAPAGVRVETGVEAGSDVTIHYDSMLAKLIATSSSRQDAIRQLRTALRKLVVQGPVTNRLYLLHLLEQPAFEAGETHTSFIEEAGPASNGFEEAKAAALLTAFLAARAAKGTLAGVRANFRNNPFRDPQMKFEIEGRLIDSSYQGLENNLYRVQVGGVNHAVELRGAARVEIDGLQLTAHIAQDGELFIVDTATSSHRFTRVSRYPQSESGPDHETANSPMPGQVLRILVEPGKEVKPGDPLLVLEAMKMEQTIRAGIHGRVGQVLVRIGQVVQPGQMLVEIGPLLDVKASPTEA